MSEVVIKGDLSPITDALRDIELTVVPNATRMGINRALAGVRTDARREISSGLDVPQKEIKDSLTINKATKQRFYEGSLRVGGSSRDIVPLGASRKVKNTKRKGITFKGNTLKGAFQIPGIRRGVFRQVPGRPRYKRTGNIKVQPLHHFTPAQQFTHSAQAKVAVRVPNRMIKAFNAALTNQLKRKGFR